ncbi:NAD-dependent epimerase/dehydratase family protein [Ammoniphilus sp. YIM 78166]|uniref:NAD-dependent epimerase/dehydratase family protein n=1 Tax=Ammoniphilus sp. YIM 78166 TaxID=1644106 RepID=UPI00106F4881|nr:NAD-dependent epimerase/dehydratase family protein [Ammoniphilus sp. YIM 78166]
MKILVTGGAGFIGSHLVDRYVGLGCEVIAVDNLSTGDRKNVHPQARFVHLGLSDQRLEKLILEEKPDLINHHAAQVNVRTSVSEPITDLEINLRDTIRLLDASGKAGIKKFIFASSGGAVYGECTDPPTEAAAPNPISPYGINKWAAERYVAFYAQSYGFDWTILRYANVYGPRQVPHSESGVIAIFIDHLLKGIPPTIYGNGEQIRDFIHVHDVVEANMRFSRLNESINDVFNVGTGRGTSLNELVSILNRTLYQPIPAVYTRPKFGDLVRSILSIGKIEKWGWTPRIDLEDGLKELFTRGG